MRYNDRTEIEYCNELSGWTVLITCNDVGVRCVSIGIPASSALTGRIPLGSCYLNYQIRIDAVGSDRICDGAASAMGMPEERRCWISYDFGRYGYNRDIEAVRSYFGEKAACLTSFIFPDKEGFSVASISKILELTEKLIPRLKEKELILNSRKQHVVLER